MNLPAVEVPHLIILSLIVHQHYGCVILRTSQLSSSAIAVQLDPDDTMLMEIDDKYTHRLRVLEKMKE